MPARPPVALIVAVAENGVIGKQGAMPWHLPDELAHFKRVTMGKPIIMGRKTFQSLGRSLPGRTNIVVTRDAAFAVPDGVIVTHDLEDAIKQARAIAERDGASEIMVIGGAQIYAAAMPMASRLYLTRIHRSYEGDAWFSWPDREGWIETGREDREGDPAYSLMVYERTAGIAD